MAGTPSGPATQIRRRRVRVDPTAVGLILVIFLTEAVIGILLLAVNQKYPHDVLHGGAAVTGLAISVYGAAKMPGQPLGGWLADRLEPRFILSIGIALSLPVIILMAGVPVVAIYIIAWVGFGLALAVVWPTIYAIVGRRFLPSLQGRLLALVSMGQIAGTALGTVIGAFVMDKVSFGAAYGLAFALESGALLTALSLAIARRRTTPNAPVSPADSPSAGRQLLGRTLATLLDPSVVMLILLIMLVSVAVAMLTPDLEPYGKQVLGLEYSKFVLLLIPPAAVAGLLLIPSGYISDHFGRNLPMLVGLVIFSASLFLLSLVRVAVLASAIACLAAAGYVLMLPALSASLLDLSSAENRGLVTGVSTSIQAIGLVVGPPVGGWLADAFDPIVPIRASAGLVGATILLGLIYAGRTRTVYQARQLERAARSSEAHR